jgi:CheY-like chemotaxis protein
LTKQLLGFAKGGKYEVKTLDINEIIRYNSDLFSQTRKEVEIELQLDYDDRAVDVDRSQIDQVMYNLYVNAWQAMIDGGRIGITTANVDLTEGFVEPFGVPPGKYVKIEVEDDGQGMDQETLRRIFDPFFTTKEISRGIGLGLASSYGIIQNHSGIIEAKSELGVGTCFSIYLPVSSHNVEHNEAAADLVRVVKGKERILIVDDENMIIEVGMQMLKVLGYEATSASSGSEAVEIFRKSPDRFDLIILDMIMPGMSGGETFDAFKLIDSEVRVVLSSGYSLDEKANAILARGCLGFLQKPFDLRTLSEKIRDVLESYRKAEYSVSPES